MSTDRANGSTIKNENVTPGTAGTPGTSNKTDDTPKDGLPQFKPTDTYNSLDFISDILKESSIELRQSQENIQKLSETAKAVNIHMKNLEDELNKMRNDLFECLAQPVNEDERLELVERVSELMKLLESLAEQKGTVKLMQSQIQERIDRQQEFEEREKAFRKRSEELKKWKNDPKARAFETYGVNVDDIIKNHIF